MIQYKPKRASSTVLSYNKLTKRFGDFVAVDALSLSISGDEAAFLGGEHERGVYSASQAEQNIVAATVGAYCNTPLQTFM